MISAPENVRILGKSCPPDQDFYSCFKEIELEIRKNPQIILRNESFSLFLNNANSAFESEVYLGLEVVGFDLDVVQNKELSLIDFDSLITRSNCRDTWLSRGKSRAELKTWVNSQISKKNLPASEKGLWRLRMDVGRDNHTKSHDACVDFLSFDRIRILAGTKPSTFGGVL